MANLFERYESGFQSLDPYHQNTVLIDVLNGIANGTVALNALKVTGDLTVNGSETVTGNEFIGGTLLVTGASTLAGAVHASNDLIVAGNETVTGTLVQTGNVSLNGSVVIGATGGAHALVGSASSVTVTATANTDFIMAVPPGSTIVGASAITTTTFGAATDAKIQLGSSVGGSDYVAGTTVSLQGAHALTLLGGAQSGNLINMPTLTGGANIFGRLVQTGTASSIGGSTIVVTAISP